MHCTNHPDVSANTLCTRCDRFLCPDCVEERNGRAFCSDCAAFVDRRAQERPRRPPAAPDGADVPPPPAASASFDGAGEDGLYQGPAAGEDGLYQGPAAGAALGVAAGGAVAAPRPVAGGSEESFGKGILYGTVGGVVGVLIWFLIAAAAESKLAIVGSFLGFAVAHPLVKGAGYRGSGEVVLAGVGMTAGAVLLGEVLIAGHMGILVISVFDLILYAIALFEAYRVTAKG